MKIAIIFAEHGRPSPDVSQYCECWPQSEIHVWHGTGLPEVPQLEPLHPRYGWRMNDYWKVRKMLDCGADVAMCFDSDMWICDMKEARSLPQLAAVFGLCLPMNPRYTVKRDYQEGADVDGVTNQFLWNGPSLNCSPIALDLRNARAVAVAEEYCHLMLAHPQRGPMHWWNAAVSTGTAPLILPPQWCVCEKHIGVGGEIILHHGHEAVKRHYGCRRVS